MRVPGENILTSAPLAIGPHAQITTAWLNAALERNGIDAAVAPYEVESVGTGQLGATKRFDLRYVGAVPPAGPPTLVGKCSLLDLQTAAQRQNSAEADAVGRLRKD